jgi:hypothetical protein
MDLSSGPPTGLSAPDRLQWIRELARAEQTFEETGLLEPGYGLDANEILLKQTLDTLVQLKASLVEAASAFNQLKGSAAGRVKVYGVSNTHADFMLFRNGYKLIFGLKEPGVISIRMNHLTAPFSDNSMASASGASAAGPDEVETLEAQWGAFGDLTWTYQGHAVKIDLLVRFYLTRFVRESVK